MSLNTTFKSWEDMINHLQNVDAPQCFTVNYLPDTEEYEIWIGNQPYYNYEKLIALEAKDNNKLVKRIKQLNNDKENMYKIATRADFGEVDWNKFERVFSK